MEILGRGIIPVKDVKMGDVFTITGGSVTSIFLFEADGQRMVDLNGIRVSTNHFVELTGTPMKVKAVKHPDARAAPDWNGGLERPLVCFNTSDHCIPIGPYRFLDYDETEDGDVETMKWVDKQINGLKTDEIYEKGTYTTAIHPDTQVKLKDGSFLPLHEIKLGQGLSTGKVIGLIKKIVSDISFLPSGDKISSGNLVWNPELKQWRRLLGKKHHLKHPEVYISLIVSPTASIELRDGHMVRDYLEVHSPEAEMFYAKEIESSSSSER